MACRWIQPVEPCQLAHISAQGLHVGTSLEYTQHAAPVHRTGEKYFLPSEFSFKVPVLGLQSHLGVFKKSSKEQDSKTSPGNIFKVFNHLHT